MESVDLLFQEVHVGVEEDEGEGDAEVEQKPDVYCLDVGCWWQVLTYLGESNYYHYHYKYLVATNFILLQQNVFN